MPDSVVVTLKDIRRRRWRAYALATLAGAGALSIAAAVFGWRFHQRMAASLPQLDGTAPLAGLCADVSVSRDALGVPSIRASSRADAARALGFLHAQDRFFQMDLTRRRAAGELSELFGEKTLEADKSVRIHGLRAIAQRSLALLPSSQCEILDAYTAGVNAGLAHLRTPPFEYLLLGAGPRPWLAEDCILVIHAMALDLQNPDGVFERTLDAIRDCYGNRALAYFAPAIAPDDSALDGSTAPLAPIPGPRSINLRAGNTPPPAAATAPPPPPPVSAAGSNSMAFAGARGAAMIESDMHLALRVPNTWYRVSLSIAERGTRIAESQTQAATRAPPEPESESEQSEQSEQSEIRNPKSAFTVTGVTIPGAPAIVAGSNGKIAWGFTNSYADTSDVVMLSQDPLIPLAYHSKEGVIELVGRRTELILVRGQKTPVALHVETSIWGPVIGANSKGIKLALKWVFDDPAAANYDLMELETASTAAEAVRIANRAGIPAQNMLVADSAGNIAWTICGRLPGRFGYDGRLPASWAFGDRGWRGLLPPEKTPSVFRVASPAAAVHLSTANQRLFGGEIFALFGDGGYVSGARGARIREMLSRLGENAAPADLLAIALDDHAPGLARWHKLLRDTLASTRDKKLARLRDAAGEAWDETTGRASLEPGAYPIVRIFRQHVIARVLAPIFEPCADLYPQFNYNRLRVEGPVWGLLQEKPAHLLAPEYASWHALLLAAAADTRRSLASAGFSDPARARWGAFNVSRIRHPLSEGFMGLAGRVLGLDMPARELPGDGAVPRVQHPAFGASMRFVVSPGREDEGIFEMPCGQSGHPLSPYYRAGHDAWMRGDPSPFLPGPAKHTLLLKAAGRE